jgi:hypothetical protein
VVLTYPLVRQVGQFLAVGSVLSDLEMNLTKITKTSLIPDAYYNSAEPWAGSHGNTQLKGPAYFL